MHPHQLRLGALLLVGGCAPVTTSPWSMPRIATRPEVNEVASTSTRGESASDAPPARPPSAERGELPDMSGTPADPLWRQAEPEAREEAKRRHRPLFVSVSAEWCVPCKLLEADTLSDPRVRARLEAEFVALHIDATEESDETRRVTSTLRLRGVPTLLVLDTAGNERLRIVQYVDAEALLAALDRATQSP